MRSVLVLFWVYIWLRRVLAYRVLSEWIDKEPTACNQWRSVAYTSGEKFENGKDWQGRFANAWMGACWKQRPRPLEMPGENGKSPSVSAKHRLTFSHFLTCAKKREAGCCCTDVSTNDCYDPNPLESIEGERTIKSPIERGKKSSSRSAFLLSLPPTRRSQSVPARTHIEIDTDNRSRETLSDFFLASILCVSRRCACLHLSRGADSLVGIWRLSDQEQRVV